MKKYLTLGLVAAMLATTTPSRAKDVDFLDITAYMSIYVDYCQGKLTKIDEEHLKTLSQDYHYIDVINRMGKLRIEHKKMNKANFCAFIKKGYINVYDP